MHDTIRQSPAAQCYRRPVWKCCGMTAPARVIARWPEMMVQRDAADYCSLSIAAFEREVYAGRLPAPVRFGGKDHWRKTQIDAALDAITGDGTGIDKPAWERELENRYAR